MKISNKRELQQTAPNHWSDINSKDFIEIYKKCNAEPYSFLVNDATLASDNPLRLRKNFLIYNKIMTIDDQIRDENCNTILTEKLPKYQPYHVKNLVSMNILQEKKYYHLIKKKKKKKKLNLLILLWEKRLKNK